MLIRFVVSNFMSFKDETEFNMLPAKGNGSRNLQEHIYKTNSGIEVLKTAAIYGANAAGKSNLIKAIAYLRDVVSGDELLLVPHSKRFRLDSYSSMPTTFRIEYVYNNCHFDYAIEIIKGKIKQEWLYLIKSVTKNQEVLLYKRDGKEVTFGEYFNNSKDLSYIKKYIKKELQDNQTVLNACYGNIDDKDVLDNIFKAFDKLHIVMPTYKNSTYSESILTKEKSVDFAKNLLISSRTGIQDLVINEIDVDSYFSYSDSDLKREIIDDLESYIDQHREDKNFDESDYCLSFLKNSQLCVLTKNNGKYTISFLKTKHFNSDNLFDFTEESDGTNRLFELSPAFEELIYDNSGTVYIVDELERSMHPLLAKELLKMYSQSNTSKSQLIFTTHESHLLDNELLRRDEIWFAEKKDDGSTEFYPLSNFNPRGDKVLERGYLEGRYGGIPYLGDFSKLIEDRKN